MKKKQKHVLRRRSRQNKGSVFSALCLCVAFCYLAGPLALAGSWGDHQNAEKLYSTGISTTGTVTDIYTNNRLTFAVGNFVTITGQTVSFQYEIDNRSAAFIGEPVALIYNPTYPYGPDGVFVGTRDEVWWTAETNLFIGIGLLLFAIIGTIIIIVIVRRARFDPYNNKFKRVKKVKPDKMPRKPLL